MPAAYQFEELPVLHGLSEQEFFRLCQDNPQLRLERAANQDIIIMPPAHPDASESGTEISGQLWQWNRERRTGHTYESSAGFRLPDGSVRAPDVAWLSNARRRAAGQAAGFLTACPEFVVEVLSPSDRLPAVQAKMEEYLANGVQLGFLLDVAAETAYVYRPSQAPETVVGYDQTLSAEPVLPGFALDLRPLRRAH
ncbi:Uma2 family endonuclease [Hymenobacter sp. BT664]|uniref:Uma2 family endonuclease n=1 Tax=Hymenobacter montanus TaxID=2771359 RepID=A0A927BAE9_9BACT|nr:Uma2 family endonuclease [Hymenobacter montanus]MBD2767107.1 Uma2 family endonuclease [Hymenobacter montanus]